VSGQYALDEHVVAPRAAAIHGQLAAAGEHAPGEFLGRELAALIGVDDLRCAVAGKGLLEHLGGVNGLARTARPACDPRVAPPTPRAP